MQDSMLNPDCFLKVLETKSASSLATSSASPTPTRRLSSYCPQTLLLCPQHHLADCPHDLLYHSVITSAINGKIFPVCLPQISLHHGNHSSDICNRHICPSTIVGSGLKELLHLISSPLIFIRSYLDRFMRCEAM